MKPRHIFPALLCVLIAYLFSMGPAIWWLSYTDQVGNIPAWFPLVYHPIAVIREHSPYFGHLVDWYCSLWMGGNIKL